MPHSNFKSDGRIPLAYFITFRTYGTWLHGDERGSVDLSHNVYGTPMLPANKPRKSYERSLLACRPVLGLRQRAAVEKGIRETCKIRKMATVGL